MATTRELLTMHPQQMSEDQLAQLKTSLETLNYTQLRQYVLGRVKPLIENVRKHIQEDPVGSVDQVLDFQDGFWSRT